MTSPAVALRLDVAARIGAAALGGYALAVAAGVLFACLLGTPRADATLAGTLIGFVVYPAGVLWAFARRSVLRIWVELLASTVLLALAAWAVGLPPAP